MSSANEFQDYSDMLRRRWPFIVAGVVIGLLLAAAALQILPKQYASTTRVLVLPTPVADAQVSNGRTSGDINLDTESQLVSSIDVATAAGKAMKSSTAARDLIANVSVSIPANTQVLDIQYQASDPVQAQKGSHAFGQAYLDNRAALSKSAIDEQVKSLQAQVVVLQKDLKVATDKQVTLAANDPDREFAANQAKSLNDQITTIGQRIGVLSSTQINSGRIISDADLPTGPSSPNTLILLAGGLMGGLMLGLCLALIRERTDRRIRRGAEVERLLDVPLLTELPGRSLSSTSPSAVVEQGGRAGSGIARLRNTITADVGTHRRVLLVVGASDGAGSSFLATNLAASLARAGLKATLMAANLRDAGAGDGPRGTHRLGVSDFLMSNVNAQELTIASRDIPGLSVIGPGTQATLAADRLQTDKARELVADLLVNANYLIVLASSTASSADAQTLAHLADGVIIVAEFDRTRKDELIDAGQQLERVGARVLGAVAVPRIGKGNRAGNRSERGRGGTAQSPPAPRTAPHDTSYRYPTDEPRRGASTTGANRLGDPEPPVLRGPAPFEQGTRPQPRES
ncbi:MAG: hypothetical protein WCB04_09585 [Mycobacteriales bacterium]